MFYYIWYSLPSTRFEPLSKACVCTSETRRGISLTQRGETSPGVSPVHALKFRLGLVGLGLGLALGFPGMQWVDASRVPELQAQPCRKYANVNTVTDIYFIDDTTYQIQKEPQNGDVSRSPLYKRQYAAISAIFAVFHVSCTR